MQRGQENKKRPKNAECREKLSRVSQTNYSIFYEAFEMEHLSLMIVFACQSLEQVLMFKNRITHYPYVMINHVGEAAKLIVEVAASSRLENEFRLHFVLIPC